MPKKTNSETPDETDVPTAKPTLRPFNVVIDGHDRTIMAEDEADLQEKIAKIRA